MKTKLVKKALRISTNKEDFSRASVTQCLEGIGLIQKRNVVHAFDRCPKKYRRVPRFEGFWGQDQYDLQDVLKEATAFFHNRIKEIHPDKHPDNATLTRITIAAFRQLQKLFAKHNIKLE